MSATFLRLCCSVLTRVTRYNYPGVTNGVIVEPDTYTQLAQHPNIVGCKM